MEAPVGVQALACLRSSFTALPFAPKGQRCERFWEASITETTVV
jgi:hypothetical protein